MIPAAITIIILVAALVVLAGYVLKENRDQWKAINDLQAQVTALKKL